MWFGSRCPERTEVVGMRQAKAAPARASSQLRAVSHSLSPGLSGGSLGSPARAGACLGFQVLHVMPSSPSLSVSPRLGHPSSEALSHRPTPQSRKPALTCWLILAETPLLLPRRYLPLLHSQPLGVSGTWKENLPMTYVP